MSFKTLTGNISAEQLAGLQAEESRGSVYAKARAAALLGLDKDDVEDFHIIHDQEKRTVQVPVGFKAETADADGYVPVVRLKVVLAGVKSDKDRAAFDKRTTERAAAAKAEELKSEEAKLQEQIAAASKRLKELRGDRPKVTVKDEGKDEGAE